VQLIAAMNPCRCGYLGDPDQECKRVPHCAVEYQSKISGPLFDRIDIHVDVPAVHPMDLTVPPPAETSADIARRVGAARRIQRDRFAAVEADPPIRTNAEAEGAVLESVAAPDEEGKRLLFQAAGRFKLTARGYHRVLKVARTLADLEGDAQVRRIHIAEALGFRRIIPGRGAVALEK